jgi:hypothetical protein
MEGMGRLSVGTTHYKIEGEFWAEFSANKQLLSPNWFKMSSKWNDQPNTKWANWEFR